MTTVPPKQPDKVVLSQGRALLEARGFEMGPIPGNRGEIWVNRFGFPVFISYIGPPYGQAYSQESLDKALAEAYRK